MCPTERQESRPQNARWDFWAVEAVAGIMGTQRGALLGHLVGSAQRCIGTKSGVFSFLAGARGLLLRLRLQPVETLEFVAAGSVIATLLHRAAHRSWTISRCAVHKLLVTGVLLCCLAWCPRRLQRAVYAAKPDTEGLDPREQMADAAGGPPWNRRGDTYTHSAGGPAGFAADIADAARRTYASDRNKYRRGVSSRQPGDFVSSSTEENTFSALASEMQFMEPPLNPWRGLLWMYDVPRVHGSGVKVDLGNEKTFMSKKYREPGGYCPVYGKFIQLQQPTRDRKIWPNDYLVPVPLQGTPQDTTPLGGGFGLPIPQISPHTLDQLKERVRQADSLENPHPYMMEYRKQIRDNLGYCVWWTRISPALDPSNKNPNLDSRYRYSVVWDEKQKVCTLLYINMQEMTGAGTYCTRGNDKPLLPWYCFSSMKAVDMKDRVWTSPYTRMDHATMCPKTGLKHVHWGQWNGRECQRLAPRKRVQVKNAAECAIALFENSPSDNPTKYVGDEGRDWGQIHANAPGVLFPSGAFGRDQPHSRGVGVNWANYSPADPGGEPRRKNECEMYDGVPDCLTLAPDGYAFVSLASPDPDDATLPPCATQLEGVFIGGPCECPPYTQQGWRCKDGKWKADTEPCACRKAEGGVNAWMIAGPLLGAGALLGILAAYLLSKRSPDRSPAQRGAGAIEDESREHHVQQQRKTQTDILQEAEPSFWKEAREDDPTVVLYDGDKMDQEF